MAPGEQEPERWSTEDKFLIVMEVAKLSQAELAEHCWQKSLLVEQIGNWRDVCMAGQRRSGPRGNSITERTSPEGERGQAAAKGLTVKKRP